MKYKRSSARRLLHYVWKMNVFRLALFLLEGNVLAVLLPQHLYAKDIVSNFPKRAQVECHLKALLDTFRMVSNNNCPHI
jgi:hypothetical protein